jgi:hypothetical protein
MAKVLVTCVGSGVGQSVIDSLNLVGGHFIVGCDTKRDIYAHHFCNEFHVVPSIYSEGYIDYLLNLCITKTIDIVIPGHDHELLLLSKNISKFDESGIKVIVSRPDIIEISRDKYAWYNFFTKFGCSIVPTYKVLDFKKSPDLTIFPAIVKPSSGSASQGITILNDILDIENVNENDIIQPYLFPTKDDINYEIIRKYVNKGQFVQMSEISIQLIFTKNSEFAGIFISKNSLKNGVPIFIDPIQPETFEHLDEIMKFVPILSQHKVKGPVNIQGRITDKGLLFFEMNMRFTGITGNRAQLGFNEVEFLVNNFQNRPGVLNGYAINKLGVRQVACTTIPRLKENRGKLTITVLGFDPNKLNFIEQLAKTNLFRIINVVCSNNQSYALKFQNELFSFISENDIALNSILSQTDVLINLHTLSILSTEYSKDDIMFFAVDIVRRIVKSNIPIIINPILDQETFEEKLMLSIWSSIDYFNPDSHYIILHLAYSDHLFDEILKIIK